MADGGGVPGDAGPSLAVAGPTRDEPLIHQGTPIADATPWRASDRHHIPILLHARSSVQQGEDCLSRGDDHDGRKRGGCNPKE